MFSKLRFQWNSCSNPHICEIENHLKMIIFQFFSKILSKSPCVRVSHFSVFSIFVKKVTFKIPIGTILNFFCKKSRFLHTLEIFDFTWDNHVIYRKKITFFFRFSTHFPHSWRVEISLFSIIFPIVQTQTPPPVLLRKRQKVPKFYLWVFRQNSKNMIINRETVFTKIFEKFEEKTFSQHNEGFSIFCQKIDM